jgi:hypothetical protein
MSYRCGECGTQVAPSIRPERVITQVREVNYTTVSQTSSRYDRDEPLPDKTSKGWEIVKEIFACGKCATRFRKGEPEVVGSASRTFTRPRPKSKFKKKRSFRNFE